MSLHRSRLPEAAKCPVRDVLDRLTDRWSILAVIEMAQEPRRFGALAEAIPDISDRMLVKTLRQLEESGIVMRQSAGGSTMRSDYALTPLGQSLLEPISAMIGWAETHHEDVRRSRAAFAATASSSVRAS